MSDLVTDIFNYKSKEFFRNMDQKEISKIPKGHKDYIALRDYEKEKSLKGVNINGVIIPGSLYYTLNHHKMGVDQENGTIDIVLPDLRDNDWIIHEEFAKAEAEKLGFALGSARQVGKSEFIVAMTLRELFLKQNTEAVGVFTTKPDKQTFTKKAQVAIEHGTDFIVIPNISKDWTKEEMTFGAKRADNTNFIYSRLYLYLNNRGHNTEVAAGKTISWYFMDEIAKEEMKGTWEAVRPALKGKFGLRCSPLFAFTGGDVEKSQDAEGIYLNPAANKIKSYDNHGKETGFFMSSNFRQDFKKKQPLTNFYEDRYGIKLKDVSDELQNMEIYVADEQLATTILNEEEALSKSESLLAYQKQKMYNPRKISDMFIKGETNPFIHLKDFIDAHIEDLNSNPRHKVYNIKDGVFNFSKDKYLDKYPLTESVKLELDKMGICVTSQPEHKFLEKEHVAGADPFNTIKTATSPSLGSWYIMKKATADYEDPYANSIVAWYNGRTNISKFRNKLYEAIKAYRTTLLHEAADDNTTQWFLDKDEEALLENTYSLNREINPKTKALNAKGLRPIINTQNFYIELILQYLEEELPDGKKGLTRIPDSYLLEQILMYDGDLAPMDAIVAFGHTLMHLQKDKKHVPRNWNYEVEESEGTPDDMFGLFSKPKLKTKQKNKSII
jgi:hypothetical protein